jgi:hypothetical protein
MITIRHRLLDVIWNIPEIKRQCDDHPAFESNADFLTMLIPTVSIKTSLSAIYEEEKSALYGAFYAL